MKKKQTLRDVVIAAVKANGPIKPKNIIAATKRPAGQVYTALHKLFKENTIDKTAEGGYFFIGDAEQRITPKQEAVRLESATEKKLAQAYAEIDNLQRQVHDLTIKYLDTQAVLKYIESKIELNLR